MTIDANRIFEDELSRRGLAFVKENEDEYRVDVNGWKVSANLTNVRRNAERDQDPGAIRRFVDRILEVPVAEPSWHEASKLLLFSAESADTDFGDSIWSAVTDEVSRVLTLTDEAQTSILWVTPQMCEKWGVSPAAAASAALVNQDRLLAGIDLEIAGGSGVKLGMIPLASPYKASVIFAPAFKQFVERELGWPVLVVVPCRDFIYVLANDCPLLPQIGPVVVREFRDSGYPITTEVLRISDEGIEAIGHFPK